MINPALIETISTVCTFKNAYKELRIVTHFDTKSNVLCAYTDIVWQSLFARSEQTWRYLHVPFYGNNISWNRWEPHDDYSIPTPLTEEEIAYMHGVSIL